MNVIAWEAPSALHPGEVVEELEEAVDLVRRGQALGLERGDLGDLREVERSDPATLAQDLRRRGDDRVEAEVRIGGLERARELRDMEVPRQVARPSVIGIGPAQPDGGQPVPVADVVPEADAHTAR